MVHESMPPPQEQLAAIRERCTQVQDGHVKALLLAFLDDAEIAAAFVRAPAAMRIHHAFEGGLIAHTFSLLQLADKVCDHYPQLDRDLVIAGLLLHDIGKTREISPEPGFEYTDEGKLVGHLILACQWIREKASRIEGFPRELEMRITHLIAAHHGKHEYGSPKEPATLEAVVVHALDELDTRVNSFEQLFAAAPPEARWTDRKNMYGRSLLIPRRK